MHQGTSCVWAGTVMGTGFLAFPIRARKNLGADAAFQLLQLKAEPQNLEGGVKDVGLIRKLNMGENEGDIF